MTSRAPRGRPSRDFPLAELHHPAAARALCCASTTAPGDVPIERLPGWASDVVRQAALPRRSLQPNWARTSRIGRPNSTGAFGSAARANHPRQPQRARGNHRLHRNIPERGSLQVQPARGGQRRMDYGLIEGGVYDRCGAAHPRWAGRGPTRREGPGAEPPRPGHGRELAFARSWEARRAAAPSF